MDQRAITDNAQAALTENLGKLRTARSDYFQLLEKSLASSQLPTADLAKQYCDYLRRNVSGTFDLCERLIQANDVQDVMKSQTEFVQGQMRSLTEQTSSMGEATMKAMTGALAPKR